MEMRGNGVEDGTGHEAGAGVVQMDALSTAGGVFAPLSEQAFHGEISSGDATSTTRLIDSVIHGAPHCRAENAVARLSKWPPLASLSCQHKKPRMNERTKVESQRGNFQEEVMPKKPTIDDARLILELYELRREPELRKARHWWLTTFWPKSADDFVKVATAIGSEENNWLRQVGSYWGIAASFVLHDVVSEKLFYQLSFCGEMYFIFAKVRPFLPELRKKMKNPELFLTIEKTILGSKVARAQFEQVEARIASMWQKK
jgi:hypothetical protein